MRVAKTTVLWLLLIFTLSGLVTAQNTCENISRSTVDVVRLHSQCGEPGDTVYMPISVQNDSVITSFVFLIQFDTAWLTPVYLDETFIDYRIPGGNRFQKLDTLLDQYGFDSLVEVTPFTAVHYNEYFEDQPDIIAANFLPTRTDGDGNMIIDSLVGGNDIIFELPFTVNENMPDGQIADLKFYTKEVIANIDTVFPYDTTWAGACATSQVSINWRMPVAANPDSLENQTFQIFPQIQSGVMRCDFNCTAAPSITSFTASPTNINPGGSSSLAWNAANADSVVLELIGGARITASTSLISSYAVSPSTQGTYTYRLTAYGGGLTSSATTTVTVGTAPQGDGPIITLSPSTTSYTINQGETVSFEVTATSNPYNASEGVTLSSGSLSNNMTFAGGTNVGAVTATFSFTPDFNQLDGFSITFNATDADASSSSSVVFTVEGIEYDRLFSTSAEGQKPVGGLPGAKEIFFPINLITQQTVYGVQFDMSYPYSLITVDSFVTSGRIPEWVVYENVGVTPGEIKVVTFGLANEPVELDTTSAIMYAVLTLDSSSTPWTSQTIHMANGRESVSPDPNLPSLPLVTDSGIVEIDRFGDVNLDRWIDVGDAVNVVASVIGNYGLSPRQFATADVIINDTVNVFDLIGIVNLIYNIPVSPSQGSPVFNEEASLGLDYADLMSGSSEVLTVTSELPEQIAGVQLEISYDPGAVSLGKPALTQDNSKFAISYKDDGNGNMKVLLYHMAPFKDGELLQIGDADLVDIPIVAHTNVASGDESKLRLTQALLSTSSAQSVPVQGVNPLMPGKFTLHQNYPNPFNPSTTISFSVDSFDGGLAAKNVSLDVYNVLGQTVVRLIDGEYPPGDHQIEWDATDDDGQRVATGIYLYRLSIGEESQTKKMLFLK